MSLSKPDKRLLELARKWLSGTISQEEKVEFEQWYGSFDDTYQEKLSDETVEQLEARLHQNIFEKAGIPQQIPVRRIRLWPRIAAAAAILAFLSFGLYQYFHKNVPKRPEYANDIAPGTSKPYITLANGQKVIIGDNKGVVAKQGGISIRQNIVGQVSYTGNAQVADAPFNTLTNPRGSKVVSLILPDGTLAKLDAASSITYQTAFTGKSRNISTTGKVYFAVNYNKEQPFYVATKGQITEDLGTHFIVEAYDDEQSIKTTLIEGSVSVSKNGQKALLKPGQQAITTTAINTQQADLDEETAWINGDFDFNKQDLHSIMRELARVYDIDVNYEGNVEDIVLDGMISRSHNISAVLQMIEITGKVHFEINGRRVMVIAGHK